MYECIFSGSLANGLWRLISPSATTLVAAKLGDSSAARFSSTSTSTMTHIRKKIAIRFGEYSTIEVRAALAVQHNRVVLIDGVELSDIAAQAALHVRRNVQQIRMQMMVVFGHCDASFDNVRIVLGLDKTLDGVLNRVRLVCVDGMFGEDFVDLLKDFIVEGWWSSVDDGHYADFVMQYIIWKLCPNTGD